MKTFSQWMAETHPTEYRSLQWHGMTDDSMNMSTLHNADLESGLFVAPNEKAQLMVKMILKWREVK